MKRMKHGNGILRDLARIFGPSRLKKRNARIPGEKKRPLNCVMYCPEDSDSIAQMRRLMASSGRIYECHLKFDGIKKEETKPRKLPLFGLDGLESLRLMQCIIHSSC